MNLERFYAAVRALRTITDREQVLDTITALQTALQNSISSPNPKTAEAFKVAYATTLTTLQESELNKVHPTQQKILEALNARGFIGSGLWAEIQRIVVEHQITPATLLTELTTLLENLRAFLASISQLDDVLRQLGVKPEELAPGAFEIGVSIPCDPSTATLDDLKQEIDDLDLVLKTFAEVCSGRVDAPVVKTVSASDWQFFFEAVPSLAACTAVAIERIVALYKSMLEIKKLKRESEDKGLPAAVIEGIDEHIETSVKDGVRQIAEDLVNDNYHDGDPGRKNELTTQMSIALKLIARRIDKGAIFEVRATPPAPLEPGDQADPVEGGGGVGAHELLVEMAQKVNERTLLTYRLSQSTEPILSITFDMTVEDERPPSA